MQTVKFIAFVATMIAAFFAWLLTLASIFVAQSDGIFWYGIAGIVLGVVLKLESKFHWF